MKRSRSRVAFLAGCVMFALAVGGCENAKTPSATAPQPNLSAAGHHPNVVWIVLDALRAQNLSAYGYDRATTPNLDRLAASGVLFENHSTQGFNTVDSVPSYMTGRYFASPCIGQLPWEWAARTPPADEQLIPKTLSEAGYQSLLVTAHLWMTPETRIWKSFDTPVFVAATEPGVVQAPFEALSVEALRLVDARDTARPFFLYLHALDTHFPHIPREAYRNWLPEGITHPTPPFDEAEREYLRGLYDGDLAYTDDQVGKLLAELDRRGLREDTIVVVSSDHGEILGEDGKTADHLRMVSRRMLLTPLIMAGPGLPQGKRTAELTENVDIVPTILRLTSVQDTARHDGQDLTKIFEPGFTPPFRKFGLTWKRSLAGAKSFVLRSQDWVYEADPEYFWSGIPVIGATNELMIPEPSPELRAEVQAAINLRMGSYEAFTQRPATTPVVFYMPVPGTATPREAYVPFEDRKPDDNRWDLMEGLVRTWPGESAPPITLEIPVPNGTYSVQMEINTTVLPDGGPHCVIAYRVESDETWSIVASPRLMSRPGYAYVDIGEHTVQDGSFTITLRQALPGIAAASVQKFKFIPSEFLGDAAQLSPNEQGEVDEKLRALGYLN